MILVDLNQVFISNLMQSIGSNPKAKLEEGLIRHMVLNGLRGYSRQFKSKYGDMVICCDSKRYWRREVFPFYKHNRKKSRDDSGFDWAMIFNTLDKIRQELKDNFPYKVIDVDGAEADDVIATLTAEFSKVEEVLILSSDKDFVQLQKYPNVTQYSPILKKFIKSDNPIEYVKEHIIRGDRGDGIPNFLSPDNSFALGERQKVINKKKLTEWLMLKPEDFCTTDTMMRNYKRNQTLVDFDYVPSEIKSSVIQQYQETKKNPKKKLFEYMIENNLNNLLEVIDEF